LLELLEGCRDVKPLAFLSAVKRMVVGLQTLSMEIEVLAIPRGLVCVDERSDEGLAIMTFAESAFFHGCRFGTLDELEAFLTRLPSLDGSWSLLIDNDSTLVHSDLDLLFGAAAAAALVHVSVAQAVAALTQAAEARPRGRRRLCSSSERANWWPVFRQSVNRGFLFTAARKTTALGLFPPRSGAQAPSSWRLIFLFVIFLVDLNASSNVSRLYRIL